MASKKGSQKPVQSQAERLLEATRKARTNQGGQSFARAVGKATLTRQGRKTAKGQIGG